MKKKEIIMVTIGGKQKQKMFVHLFGHQVKKKKKNFFNIYKFSYLLQDFLYRA